MTGAASMTHSQIPSAVSPELALIDTDLAEQLRGDLDTNVIESLPPGNPSVVDE